jgi:RNA polymerase sigma-70 factor (ECF subfamily)
MVKGKFRMVTTPIDKLIKTVSQPQTRDDQNTEPVLEAAFDTHWTWVCVTLYRLVGDWDEAEDLALEVFYRLHRRPPKDQSALGSWLYRVATNVGLNALRARQRRRRYEEAAERLTLQRAAPVDPALEVERREQQERVREVLAGMKPRSAQVLVLRHSGLSYAEVAAALNVALGSVGTVLARAEKDFERRYRIAVGNAEVGSEVL